MTKTGTDIFRHTSMILATFWKDRVSFPLKEMNVPVKFQGKEPHCPRLCHMPISRPKAVARKTQFFHWPVLDLGLIPIAGVESVPPAMTVNSKE